MKSGEAVRSGEILAAIQAQTRITLFLVTIVLAMLGFLLMNSAESAGKAPAPRVTDTAPGQQVPTPLPPPYGDKAETKPETKPEKMPEPNPEPEPIKTEIPGKGKRVCEWPGGALWLFKTGCWNGYIDIRSDGRYYTHWGWGHWAAQKDGSIVFSNDYDGFRHTLRFKNDKLMVGARSDGVWEKMEILLDYASLPQPNRR